MKSLPILAVLAAACGVATLALAEGSHHHDHGTTSASSKEVETPATRAFRKADAQMHDDMAIRYTGDVDVDFVRGMIPHHRGAVAMAKVALEHSKNPEIRKLAEEIVRSQDGEIAWMEKFLKERGVTQPR